MVQHENISTAERSWTHPLNSLQEAIHHSIIKFCIYCFSCGTESSCTTPWDSKKLSTWSWCMTLEFHFHQPSGCITKPFRTVSLCFGVRGRTPGLIFRSNFDKKKLTALFIAIISWQDVTRCFLYIVVKRCEIKRAHNILFAKSTFKIQRTTVLRMLNDSAIIRDATRRSFSTKPATAELFMSVRVDFGQPPLSPSSTSSLPYRNQEYRLKNFDRFTASFP